MDANNHYSVAEIEEIISRLTEVEKLRLLKVFNQLGPERIGWTEEDLLQHTLVELLEGKRSWPTDVTPVKFIYNAAKSMLSNNLRKKQLGHSVPHISIDDLDTPSTTLDKGLAEQKSRAEQCVSDVFALFDELKDKDVLCVLRQMLEEVKKASILTVCKLTEGIYDAAIKKLKYRARKAFPDGLKYWDIQP